MGRRQGQRPADPRSRPPASCRAADRRKGLRRCHQAAVHEACRRLRAALCGPAWRRAGCRRQAGRCQGRIQRSDRRPCKRPGWPTDEGHDRAEARRARRGLMSRFRTSLLMAVAVLGLSACSSWKFWEKSDDVEKPAELKPISATAKIDESWKVSVGKSRTAYLQPTVVDDAVFAASADGDVYRIEKGRTVWRTRTDLDL